MLELDKNGNNLLHLACKEGSKEQVDKYIKQGVNINAKNDLGQTALHLACYELHSEIVQKLIKAGADINAQDFDGNSALHICAAQGDVKIAKILIKNDIDANLLDSFKCNALHQCAVSDNQELAELLLNVIPIDQADQFENTPLCAAIFFGSMNTASMLIEKDANLAHKNMYGISPQDLVNDMMKGM